jgi:hypothetical protein
MADMSSFRSARKQFLKISVDLSLLILQLLDQYFHMHVLHFRQLIIVILYNCACRLFFSSVTS